MENFEKLLALAKENPELKIIPLVKTEVVGDDSQYGNWIGSWGTSEVREYTLYEMYNDGEEIVFKEDDGDIVQYIEDHDDGMTEIEIEKLVDGLDWRKAIFVYIDTPD